MVSTIHFQPVERGHQKDRSKISLLTRQRWAAFPSFSRDFVRDLDIEPLQLTNQIKWQSHQKEFCRFAVRLEGNSGKEIDAPMVKPKVTQIKVGL